MRRTDDLFESSKMSFGEHLDELRVALFKAIIALVIGVSLGLWFADDLVRYIKTPLQTAIDEFQTRHVEGRYEAELKRRMAEGYPLVLPDRESGETDDELLARAAKIYAGDRLLPQVFYLDVSELEAMGLKLPPDLKFETTPDGRRIVEFTQLRRLEDDPRRDLIATNITAGFSVYFKAALVLGFVLASPVIFYFLWQFVAAGLYPHERHYVYFFLPVSLLLFLSGAALAFYGAIYFVLQFMFFFYEWLEVAPFPVINDWLSFILLLPLGFGISFQLPLVMLFLERIGIFTVANYRGQWKMAILVILVGCALLPSGDPYSLMIMSVPLWLLYYGGILLCEYFPRRRTPFGELIETTT